MKTSDKQAEPVMQHAPGDEAWVKQVVQKHLDAEVDSLDFNVTSKLSAARHRAMAEAKNSPSLTSMPGRWKPTPAIAGAITAVVLTLVLGSQLLTNTPAGSEADNSAATTAADPMRVAQNIQMEDMQMLSASEDIEFFQSMELLEWMDQNS